eukprot:scaffold127900_cov31-Prasinocladus_malaysianus.AAC.2
MHCNVTRVICYREGSTCPLPQQASPGKLVRRPHPDTDSAPARAGISIVSSQFSKQQAKCSQGRTALRLIH